MARYSLANYILSIKPNDSAFSSFGSITVGGEGNYNDSITISMDTNTFTTSGFATGAWVHTKNLSKTGTASVSISQVSDQVAKFIQFAKLFYSGDYEGFTVSLTTNDGTPIAYATTAILRKSPTRALAKLPEHRHGH